MAETQPPITVCRLQSLYWPNGGKEELELILSPKGSTITRQRFFSRNPVPIIKTRALTQAEAFEISTDLAVLGIWSLPEVLTNVIDGWSCNITIATIDKMHSIHAHAPVGDHLKLINYLMGLLPLPELDAPQSS